MPLCYPLSRHLWEGNIHVNIQNFNRLWKPLREQADFWIHVKRRVKLPFHIFVKCITYDKQQSAESYLEPVKTRFFNKYSKAEVDIYKASNGEIKSGWICISRKMLKYDTRHTQQIGVIFCFTEGSFNNRKIQLILVQHLQKMLGVIHHQ